MGRSERAKSVVQDLLDPVVIKDGKWYKVSFYVKGDGARTGLYFNEEGKMRLFEGRIFHVTVLNATKDKTNEG